MQLDETLALAKFVSLGCFYLSDVLSFLLSRMKMHRSVHHVVEGFTCLF